jgi:hypothetical protein
MAAFVLTSFKDICTAITLTGQCPSLKQRANVLTVQPNEDNPLSRAKTSLAFNLSKPRFLSSTATCCLCRYHLAFFTSLSGHWDTQNDTNANTMASASAIGNKLWPGSFMLHASFHETVVKLLFNFQGE